MMRLKGILLRVKTVKPKQIKWYNKYARAYIDRETFNYALKENTGCFRY